MELPTGNQLFIPREAYRYFPSGDTIYSGSEKNILRFIFYGVPFTNYEVSSLNQFKSLISSISLPPFYTDQELIRILLSRKFDKKQSLQSLNNAIKWRELNLSNGYHSLYQQSFHLLQSGSVYIQGIDHRYRPLIVLNLGKMDFKAHSVSEYSNLLCFTLEFAIKHLMIEGKIENWIVITDLGNCPLLKLPISDLKKLIKTLQDNYRCRMIVNYVINAPSSISFAWGMIKGVLDAQTACLLYTSPSPRDS